MAGDLATDTAVRAVDADAGRYQADISSAWEIWGPMGGYVAGVALRAAGAASPFTRPASFSCHYLGVAAFVMVLRRLRGRTEPHEGAGIAVLLRYTLRLLTLDQLSRAATLICALEVMRRDDDRLGQRRFSIGLWVGRSGTDNRMVDAEKRLSLYRSNPRDPRRSPGIPLVACPWCREAFVPGCFSIPPMRCSSPGVPGTAQGRASVFSSRRYGKKPSASVRKLIFISGRLSSEGISHGSEPLPR